MTALFVSSCQKEADKQVEPVSKGKVTVLKASVTEAETKVSADAAGKFAWQSGDAITAFDNTNANLQFTTTNGGTDTEFTFNGDATLGTYAIYPYDADHEVTGDYVWVSLPNEYTYKADETNMPMLGKIENNQASFKAIGGVLKLIIYNVPEGATKLTFTATNKQISGLFDIDDASIAEPVIATANTNTDDDKSVAINFTRQANMVFYIPLPTGEIDGFTLAFNDANSTPKTVTASFTVGRNKIINAPALNCTAVSDAVLTNAEILAVVTGSYASNNIASSSGTWSYTNGMKQASKLQIKKESDGGKLTLPSTFTSNITKIVLEGTGNGGGSAFSGTVYFKDSSTNEIIASKTVSDISLEDSITIDVPSGNTTGYITADGVIRIASVIVKFVQTGTFPSLTATDDDLEIAVGSLTATTTVSLSNPVDALGVSCVVNDEAKSWLSASISGSTLTVTASEANSTAADRDGTVTLKATGAANVVISVTQPTKIVANPSVTATAGDSKFTATWAAVPYATSYVAYLHTAPTATPATGGTNISASISESAGTYSITDYVVTNDTHYYLYVKVNGVESNYEAVTEYAVVDFTPAEAKGTLENPYLASEAYDYISTFGSNDGPDDPIYVKGYVSTANNPSSNSQTYYISDDGTTTKQFEAYKGKGISGANITASNRVNVGDYVVVSGTAVNYNGSTPEFSAGSTIITHNPKLAAPIFSVAEGTYYATQSVSLSAADGATIYYTIDGSEPTSSSSVYSTPLSISTTTSVKAFAVKADCVDSAVASATYTIEAPTQLVMSAITCSAQTGSSLTFTWTAVTNATGYQVSLDGGTNWESKQAGLSYTWTGLSASTQYTITVKAIGTANGQYTDSEPGSANGTTTAGGADPKTVSVVISTYASSNSWTTGTKYSSVPVDSNITASVNGTGSNSGKYYTTSPAGWRFYESEASTTSLRISAASGYTIKSVEIEYSNKNNGTLIYSAENIASGDSVDVNASSIDFTVGRTSGSNSGQVAISKITVTYVED